MNENRIKWLDVARSLAIISITTNHALNHSFAMYNDQLAEFNQLPMILMVIKAMINAFSRFGVPFFLMISGTLLLPKDYEKEGAISRFLKHNWLQLLITTEIWLAIMFWYKQILPGSILETLGLKSCLMHFVLNALFINQITFESMWYMPMILCVYLMIPILSMALKKINNKYFIIPICIVVFCSMVLTDVNGFLAGLGTDRVLETKLESANVFSMYVVYLLIGYFISQKGLLSKFRTWQLTLLLCISFIAFTAFQFWFFTREYDFVVGNKYRSVFTCLISVFSFELIRRMRVSEWLANITSKLARISFGIYFVHICIVYAVLALFEHFSWSVPKLAMCLILETVSFFGSILIISILKKSKFLAKNLFVIK